MLRQLDPYRDWRAAMREDVNRLQHYNSARAGTWLMPPAPDADEQASGGGCFTCSPDGAAVNATA